ncbi:glycine cleavage system aminomethyltransferase GcvT [Acidithiobacillus sp.]
MRASEAVAVAVHHTPLDDWHRAHGARMVPFAGWEMPLHYGSQLAEHEAVRNGAGFFDVSHMRPLDISGPDARTLLRYALANDVARLDGQDGKALYSTLLNAQGGILDDLIVYARGDARYRVVLNAGTAQADTAHFRNLVVAHGWQVDLRERPELAMLAVQGPRARALAAEALDLPVLNALPSFTAMEGHALGGVFVARTGYTGEDGVEVILAAEQAPILAERLRDRGAVPCGLGARDSLRLEAGLNLNGHDMSPAVTPWESNLGWTVDLRGDRDFLGRAALEAQRAAGVRRTLVGLVLDEGIPRHGYAVEDANGRRCGEITSGIFSPSLRRGIALARVTDVPGAGGRLWVSVRGVRQPALVVKPPFWRAGHAHFSPSKEKSS